MKKYFLILILSISITQLYSQSSIILPNGNVIPSMTQANRPASPTIGQLIYQTDGTAGLYIWNGTSWTSVSSGGSSGTVTNVSANAPISITNASTTPILSITQANGTTNGFLSSADWSIFNNKFSLPSLTNGSILFSNGTTISENNGSLKWTNAIRRFDVSGLNDGTIGAGYANWISGNFGGSGGNRVVLGVQNGDATIGSHTNDLGNWAKLVINPGGITAIGSLTGTGTRMVVANAIGEVSTQAIPTGNVGTVTSVSASLPLSVTNGASTPTIAISQAGASANGYLSSIDWNTFNNKQNALPNASGAVSGILTSTDWNTFNNKQNVLSNANASTSGILTSTDWNIFNNKQNILPNASTSTSGILTNTDWNIFNNKFSLPSLSSGSILFSNGSTITQNNSSFSWNNSFNRLNVSGLNDGTVGAGFSNWISGNFGGSGGNRVVIGIQNGEATIGAHNNNLSNWAKLVINPSGTTAIGSLVGTGTRLVIANPNGEISTNVSLEGSGTRMVVTNSNGEISTQVLPNSADNLGNHTATQTLILNNNKISNGISSGVYYGLKIDSSGHLGINITPTGVLEVASEGSLVYNGVFGNDVSQPAFAQSTMGFVDETRSPAKAFDNNINTSFWSNSSGASGALVQDFGSGNAKTIRRYRVIYGFGGVIPDLTWTFDGSNDNFSWTTLHNQSTFQATTWPLFTNYHTLNNTIAYRYYRINITGQNTNGAALNIFAEVEMEEENTSPTFNSGAFIVKNDGKIGVGTSAPTANLDVLGSLRFRNGAANNAILVSDANGNATWSNALPVNLTGGLNLNNNYISNNGTAAGIRIDNNGNTGIGVVPSGSNRLEVNGTGGLKATTTNAGTGTSDWIALNAGGTAGGRVVAGVLNGTATIGGHTNGLSAWNNLTINPTTGNNSTVTIGSDANADPIYSAGTPVLDRKLIVNGSIRQAFYELNVSIGPNGTLSIPWNHNLGYVPIAMMSVHQAGGAGNMENVSYTSYHIDNNQYAFILKNNHATLTANGSFRWILVW